MSDAPQGSNEWKAARLGRVTASRISDVIAKTRNGYGASRANYMAELIVERLTGKPQDTYQNAAMLWGIETEPQARAAYSFITDQPVIEVGFIPHPTIAMTGGSPDGLIGNDTVLELKCPQSSTHLDTLLGAPVPDKYLAQCSWNMAVTGRKYCDLCSFDPRFPPDMQLHIVRIPRDDKLIEALEKEVILFLKELDERMAQLTTLYRKAA